SGTCDGNASAAAVRSRPTTRPSSAVRTYARGRPEVKISSSAPQGRAGVASLIGQASDSLQGFLDALAALDQLALRERRGGLVHPERALEAAQVERQQARVEPDVPQDALRVVRGEI